MDEIEKLALFNDLADIRRTAIRPVLDQIAAALENAMRTTGLDFPVHLSIPTTGSAIITVGTQASPPPEQWDQAIELLSRILGQQFPGMRRLLNREISCGLVTPTSVAAEITTTSGW